MIEFWLNMDPAMKTFVAIGAVSSLVLTIQMVLALMGGAMEGVEADFDIGDGGEGGATGILSIRSIGAFFTGFGWTGAAAIQTFLGDGRGSRDRRQERQLSWHAVYLPAGRRFTSMGLPPIARSYLIKLINRLLECHLQPIKFVR